MPRGAKKKYSRSGRKNKRASRTRARQQRVRARRLGPLRGLVTKTAFPTSAYATLRYTARREITATGATLNSISYRANSLFDPNPNTVISGEGEGSALGLGGGHQPRGFDQYMSVYGRARVVSARISVKVLFENYAGPTIRNSAGGPVVQAIETEGKGNVPASCPVVLTLTKDTDTWSTRTAAEQMELPGTVWKFLTPNATSPCELRMSANMKEMFGPGYVPLEKIACTASANPDRMAFFHFAAARVNDDVSGFENRDIKLVAYFKIDYDVVFDNKNEYAASGTG